MATAEFSQIANGVPVARSAAAAAPIGLVRCAIELTKPRITRMVTITAGVGYVMNAIGIVAHAGRPPAGTLALTAVGCLFGTALCSGGANALNEWIESDRDALMRRTCGRPIPTRRMSGAQAAAVGTLLCVVGVVTLLLLCGPAAATVALTTILIYLFVYTPLKPVSPVSTLIGAIPGALPPLIGWSSVPSIDQVGSFSTLMDLGGWSLFALMFVWQIPHFLAIAWMYRDDYSAGGYRMLPQVDSTGGRLARSILLWSLLLLPASASPYFLMSGRVSLVYLVIALVTGLGYLTLAACLSASLRRGVSGDNSRPIARRVFFASIAHLPLLLVTLVADAVVISVIS